MTRTSGTVESLTELQARHYPTDVDHPLFAVSRGLVGNLPRGLTAKRVARRPPHPTLRDLMRHAEGRGAQSASIERHVRRCAECAQAFERMCGVVRQRVEIEKDTRVGAVVEKYDRVLERLTEMGRRAKERVAESEGRGPLDGVSRRRAGNRVRSRAR